MKKTRRTKQRTRLQALFLSFVMIFAILPLPILAIATDLTGSTDIHRTLEVSYKLKGQEGYITLADPYTIEDITKVESFRAFHTFDLEDNAGLGEPPARIMREGDYYLIDLPEKLIITNSAGGYIYGNDSKAIASYSFIEESPSNWQIKIEFTDYVEDLNEYEIHGELEFEFDIDLSAIGEDTTETIYIPIDSSNGISIDVTKPKPPPTKPVSLAKTVSSYNQQTRRLIWNIKMEPATGIFEGCVFSDTIDTANLEFVSIRHGSTNLVEGIDYTYDTATGKITYTYT